MARNVEEPNQPEAADRDTNLTADVFLRHCRSISEANAAVKAAQEQRKKIRQQAKADGITLADLDATLRMADWGRNEIRDKFETRMRYARWLNLPVGSQGELFKPVDTSDPKKAADEWKAAGITAGVTGANPEPPEECPAEFHQAYMDGWHTGQKRLADANPHLNGGKAKAAKKEPEPA